jgi:hypothetical protein
MPVTPTPAGAALANVAPATRAERPALDRSLTTAPAAAPRPADIAAAPARAVGLAPAGDRGLLPVLLSPPPPLAQLVFLLFLVAPGVILLLSAYPARLRMNGIGRSIVDERLGVVGIAFAMWAGFALALLLNRR